jgi:heptosyltransferase III
MNLCGRLTPRESAAAMRNALFFVGHDSGPLHLAAVAGVPCVGIFGNYNKPKWWHPMGHQHRIIHNMRGVRDIAPVEVYAAVCSIAPETSSRTDRRVASAEA